MKSDLNEYEQELLKRMNTKALLIIDIHNELQKHKISVDDNALYNMTEQQLLEFLEHIKSE